MPERGDAIMVYRIFRFTHPRLKCKYEYAKWFPAKVTAVEKINDTHSALTLSIFSTRDMRRVFNVIPRYELSVTRHSYGSSGKKKWYYPTPEKLSKVTTDAWTA
jgi:hypothetical protein